MTPRTGPRRLDGRNREHGQIVVVFAICLVAIIATAGLLIDGGMAWGNRRQAQAAADTSALAAAVKAAEGANSAAVTAAAQAVATENAFTTNYTDCGGVARTNGVVVNRPPSAQAEPQHRNTGFVEVITNRPMRTAFAGIVGQSCWMVSARAVASIPIRVAQCNFCSLSDWQGDDRYVLLIDNGNDLRIDGDIFSNHATWYTGGGSNGTAMNRCGADPCSAPTCGDWNGLPSNRNILMCGHSIYVAHSGGSTPTILSARSIAAAGGWEGRSSNDIIHADQLAPICPAHPKYLGYPTPFLQETNVCIGVPQIVDPLNDPGDPGTIMPLPDYEALSTCPGGPHPCGPVASPTCVAEPGTTLRTPTGTYTTPVKLNLSGTTAKYTICPGIYYGGFVTNGDSRNPSVIMLPGTYVMIGGGFNVTGTASITSVSSQGDGVSIYNSGGSEAFSENFPSDTTLIPTVCPPPVGSLCEVTGTPVLHPPGNPIHADHPVTYKLTVPKGTFAGAPVPTGTAASFTFYNGSTPIVCEAPGLTVTTVGTSLVAECTTRYTKFGSKGITAVYAGDAIYAATGDMNTQEVNPAPSASQDNIDLRTDTAPCSWDPVTDPCGRIVLHAPTAGRYSGLLIFQDRAPGELEGALGMLIQPALGAGACDMTTVSTPLGDQPKFMADGVPSYGAPFNTLPVPDPCGPLGGLSGTIYAAHTAGPGAGHASDWDAVVNIMGSGLAKIQIIGAEIDFTQGNPSHQARFAFNASDFANGKIRLVE